MKLKDGWDRYTRYSTKSSDQVRQLALAGLAVVWFFHRSDGNHVRLPVRLTLAATLIVIGLGADCLQYVLLSKNWRARMITWDPLESTCRHASLSIL